MGWKFVKEENLTTRFLLKLSFSEIVTSLVTKKFHFLKKKFLVCFKLYESGIRLNLSERNLKVFLGTRKILEAKFKNTSRGFLTNSQKNSLENISKQRMAFEVESWNNCCPNRFSKNRTNHPYKLEGVVFWKLPLFFYISIFCFVLVSHIYLINHNPISYLLWKFQI